MRKRMLSILLAFALFLSIVPTFVFGATTALPTTMTLVQQTTGEFADVDKEFVYYIDQKNAGSKYDTITIDTNVYPNVTTVYHYIYWCPTCNASSGNATSTWDLLLPEDDEAYDYHGYTTKHNTEGYKILCYKITLKNGEKVELTVNKPGDILNFGQYPLYMVHEDNYSWSAIANGKKQILSQKNTVTYFNFEAEENGTIIVKHSYGKESEDVGTSFPDVPSNSDYAAAIEYVSKKGVMVGDDQGKFNPDTIVSRAEMATIVCRVLEQTENLSNSSVFDDVPTTHWANKYIGKASELGIVNGYGDGRFGPSDPVTCEQSVTMIIRAIGEGDKANSYGGYPDGYILVAQEKNLLEGILVAQEQGMSRGSIAMLLYNYYTSFDNSSSEDGHTHNWATRHVEEAGHWDIGTKTEFIIRCDCGAMFYGDNPNFEEKWHEHLANTKHGWQEGYFDMPDTQYIIDTPARDETYCTICGVIK